MIILFILPRSGFQEVESKGDCLRPFLLLLIFFDTHYK